MGILIGTAIAAIVTLVGTTVGSFGIQVQHSLLLVAGLSHILLVNTFGLPVLLPAKSLRPRLAY